MTIRTHIVDLKEQRAAYGRLLEALESGRLGSTDEDGGAGRRADLRRKLGELDGLIEAEEARLAGRSRGPSSAARSRR